MVKWWNRKLYLVGGDYVNFVFWFLIIIILIALWFLLGFLFKPIGGLFKKIFKDTVEIMNEEDKEEKENEE